MPSRKLITWGACAFCIIASLLVDWRAAALMYLACCFDSALGEWFPEKGRRP